MTPRPRNDPEVSAWLVKSDGDARMAQAALELEDPLYDQACFHAQQAAEKALKALLVAHNLEVPRTHDIVFLVERLIEHGIDASAFLETASVLSQHGVTPRYPSFLFTETEGDAHEAIVAAKSLVAWVESCLV